MRSIAMIPLAALSACAQAAAPQAAPVETPVWGYQVVREYPHDSHAFTQGLFWMDGHLYESTGHVGASTVRRVRLEDGVVLQSADIPADQFGEGIAPWRDEIVSVTWQHGIGHRWDRKTLKRTGSFSYQGEGWGLTGDGRSLILSDGTATLRYFDPATMAETGRLQVTAGGRPVPRLNELEYVKGEIFANVWMTALIARIDPKSGNVTGWIDLGELARRHGAGDPDAVLNGIAYDAARDRLFVTGKYWPKLFEIDLVRPSGGR